MRRLLVTGAAGFIGSNFVHYWLGRHPDDRLVALDALTYAGNRESFEAATLQRGFRFVHGDIRDLDLVISLLTEERLDTIVHFAAESHVDRSIARPDVFLDVNIVGTHRLLQAARTVWLDPKGSPAKHRFHHVSTDEVYGDLGPDDAPFSETTPFRPNSPYAASKAAADHLVRAYHRTYGLETAISNCSNNYGPYQYPEKLIPLCVVNLLQGKDIPVYGDGKNVRDWMYVEDHCAGIERTLERGQPGRTYNLGGNCERDNLTLIGTLCKTLDEVFAGDPDLAVRYPAALAAGGRPSAHAISFVSDRPGHDRRYAVDARRAAKELGYEPTTDLSAGLRKTVHWYLENEPWWRGVMGVSYDDWVREQYPDS
ncbi:MAG: dTDP-glucose 4,6-dehydratase [Acidobacteriota bacterium]|nr:dTDP-glucose 4,6-dehydratase [Acidobacteriota bacterium]